MLPLGLDFFEIENSYRPMPRQSFRRVLHLSQLEIFPPDIPHRRHSHFVACRSFSDPPGHAVLAQSLNRA